MAGSYSEGTSDVQGLHTPIRNNYFYGKLMDVQHFQLEQRYFNNKRWLLNRLTYGSGVLCGLRLEVIDGQLILQPGLAIDSLGREIIVPVPTPIDPYSLTDACGKKVQQINGGPVGGSGIPSSGIRISGIQPTVVTICLAYHPCEAEMVPVLVNDCDSREGCAPSTIRESYAVIVREGAADLYLPGCADDNLFIPTGRDARASVFDVYRRLLGRTDEPCADGTETCVVLGDVELPPQGTTLIDDAVSYTGRHLVLNNSLLFEMILCLWERVEQCCGSMPATPTPKPTIFPPTTVAPTLRPTITPPATVPPTTSPPATTPPPPTIIPPALLKVGRVQILSEASQPGGTSRVLAQLTDPRELLTVQFNDQFPPNAIQVTFSGGTVKIDTVRPRETFIVTSRSTPANVQGGSISPVGAVERTNTIRYDGLKLVRDTIYIVQLKGDGNAVITSVDDLVLDGEPVGLPSGDDREGGDFVFQLRVV